MSAVFDVIVVGAGPGGIAAATVASEAGARVCLLDDNPEPGGQIWRGYRSNTAPEYPHGYGFLQWTSRLRNTNCEIWSGWRAIDRPSENSLRLESDAGMRDIEFRRLIVATGARERFLPFPGWTLPGVMGAGGLQALVKSGLDARGKRIVVAGTGPLLLAVAAGLTRAQANILGIYEQAPLSRMLSFALSLAAHPAKLIEGARYRRKVLRVPYRTNCWIVRAEGSTRVESVTVTNGRTQWTVACDWLACGFHLVPNLELPRLFGCRIVDGYVSVDSLQQSSIPAIACIGETTGIGGLEKALLEGQVAGLAAVGRQPEAAALASRVIPLQRFARSMDRAFALREELKTLAAPETVVCRCEDTQYSELKECSSWREAKLHTRCGMGACQGRVCGAATEFLFDWQQTGARPPVFPAAVSSVAAKVGSPETVHL
jgi:D-hydroxyproline dehydrogenase subunit alpha